MRRAVASLSPVSMTTSTPSSCSAATAAAAVGRGASASAISPAARPSTATSTAVRPVAGQLLAARGQLAEVDALALEQAAVADGDPAAGDGGDGAVAGHVLEPGGGQPVDARGRRRGATIARASGCSDSRSTAAVSASSSASSMPSATTSVTSGSPLVRVPVLSITTVSIRAEASSAVAFLNSTPRRAPSPVPTMIAVGVARPSASGQVMTTTVMANSSAMVSGSVGEQRPGGEGGGAAEQGDEHQPERGPVGQPLPGGLGVLRLLHQRDDLGQRGVGADLGGPDPQRAVGVDGRADDLAARGLVHRQALPGDHRLVDLGLAVLDDAVDRDLRAGPDQQQVPGDDLGGGHLDLAAVAEHDRPGWGEVEQRPDGVVGAAAGAHLEPVPEQHERGQHGGGLVEHLAAAGQGDHQRVAASRRRPRRRPAPSCPACGPAAPGRRRRRRSTPSRRSPAG